MKIAKRLLLILMSAVMMIGGGGCSMLVSESQLKKTLENSLKEKYGEEFVCVDVWAGGGESYKGVCYPENNNKLMFESTFYSNGNLSYDYYPTSIVSNELSKEFDNVLQDSFGNHYTYCYDNGGIDDEDTAQKIKNNEFSLSYYFDKYSDAYSNKMELNYTICVDTSDIRIAYDEEWDILLKAINSIKEIGKANKMDTTFRMNMYFVPNGMFDKCMEYFKEHAEIRSDFREMIEGYPKQKYNRLIKFDIGLDIFPMSKEEYINQRKEIN